ncbi:unnamed protein product [Moneuplotes crassus]|uniref:T-cell immunomodulatory protein TIP C2 domain-containing protein n=1 Tax=Euplotes crassus TaxID=5936 RepID=A0AAD1U115_EUPCR|nr:unnamed protein product [Moneuplotes crassus]
MVLCILIAFCLSICNAEAEEKVTIDEFNKKIFWEKDSQGMVELDLFYGNITGSMLVAAVGDLDGDKFTDLIAVNSERSAFKIFLYDSKSMQFIYTEKEFPAECIIANIQTMPHNGGLLLTCSKPESILKVFKSVGNDPVDFEEVKSKRTQIKRGNQPFIADFNGDFYPDILFQSNDGIKIAFNTAQSDSIVIEEFDKYIRQKGEHGKCLRVDPSRQLASPGSIGYVDVDGDCVADLLMTTKDSSGNLYLEVYISILEHYEFAQNNVNFSTRYCLVKKALLPDDMDPTLLFADFDREGMIDVLGFSSKKKSIYLFLNGLKPRSSNSDNLCHSFSHIQEDHEIFPGLDGSKTMKSNENVMINRISKIPYYKQLHGHTEMFPPRLRFGDIDSDGYPDLIATFELSGHNAFAAVLTNTECKNPSTQKCNKNDRVFEYNQEKYNEDLKKHNDVNYAFFFDIEENGNLDVILSVHDVNERKDKLVPLMTNYDQDSFYLKTKVVRHLEAKNDIVLSGATIRASFTQLGDEKYILVGTQRSQDSYANLGVSYSYFGIGRSNNYIEAFTVGAVVYGKKVVRTWTPIIPNTQLIVSTQMSQNPADWEVELLVWPIKAMNILVVVIALFLLVLILLIIIMHFAEKSEDEKMQVKAFDYF